jgi:hypothetical protein
MPPLPAGRAGGAVPTGAKPLLRLGTDGGRSRRRLRVSDHPDPRSGRLHHGRLPLRQVVFFGRVRFEVVQFLGGGLRSDDFPPPVNQGRQRRPPQYSRIQGFGVDLVRVCGRREEIAALHAAGDAEPGQPKHRRRDIYDAHGLTALAGNDSRARHHERNPQRAVIEEHPVRALAMFAEALAMVAEDNDERRVAGRDVGHRPEQAADLGVGVGHFAVVGVAAGPGQGVGGRRVWRVRIVEMHPQEVRPAARRVGVRPAAQPRDGPIGDGRSRALGLEPERRARRPGNLIVVRVEAGAEAELAIEHERADERGRVAAGVPEELRQRGTRPVETVGAVQAHARHRGNRAGHQADVGRKREGHGGPGREEPRAARPDGVDRGRERTADAVGAKRVDSDEDDVGRRLCRIRLRRRPPASCAERQADQQRCRAEEACEP